MKPNTVPKTTTLMFYINPHLESLILTHQAKAKANFNPFPREAMASLRVSCVVALICMVVVSAPMAEAAISCGAVTGAIAPCFAYLKGAPAPSLQCCAGVRRLNGSAQTIADRKAVCNCLKSGAGSVPGLKSGNVAALPGKCGVRLPFAISPSTNCNAISF
ncbi:hypothetical protein KIW84_076267 [Lathyrus oleraceus]|uniref:Non-specific lipid-transfer protein n=3 Tax=Pisum sativum TaxID=3888 RepID=A0A9D4VXQ3_PEA|nr:hypothetical protein KIW84_076267 [Pisum sativum]